MARPARGGAMEPVWIAWFISALLWLAGVQGYDGYSACPKAYRSVRHRAQLPCDFQQQSWCTVPGSAYPWHAVRRFVHENHGLMRRMYGDERHISVLRAEIESNDVELVRDPGWHLEDDVKRRYSAKPHFRPANRNHQPPPPPALPPVPPSPPEPLTSAAPAPPTGTSAAPTTTTPTTSSMTPSSSSTQTSTSSTTTSTATTTTSTTSSSASLPTSTDFPSTSTSAEPSSSESLGLYNGRIHPHLINSSHLFSSSTQPSSPTTSSASSSTTSTTPSDTTVEDWTTDETTLTTLHASTSTSPSTTSTSTSTAATSTQQDDELADVEDNVADEPDGDDADAGSSAQQETLFQDADHLPGPDAAQQPGKPATPLIKLRGVNACPVKEEVVAPFWANNTRGEVLALLNLYPFEQYVHWEKCTHEHKQMFCREGCRCEQQYRLHRLLAYDPNNECRGIFSDWFKFPSCCICRCYDLPAEFRFTSRSPRTPALRSPAPAAPAAYAARRPRPNPHAAPTKDWYRLQAGSGG